MRSTIAALLVASAVSLFAASGDVPLSPTLEAPLPTLAHVAVATSGLEYLVVYAHGTDIYWQRVAADGTALDPLARKLEGATLAPGARHWIEAVWTGSAYLVLWNEPGNVVVGAALDRNGIATSEFTVATGATLRDVVRRENETGVLTSAAGGAWRFTILNPNGARLGSFPVSSDAELRIVRLDEGWTLVAIVPEGLRITNLNGASRVVPGAGNAIEVHASSAGGALVVQGDGTLSVLRPNGTLAPVVLSRPVEPLSVFHAVLVSPSPSGWTLFYRGDGAARIATVRTDGSVALDSFLTGPFPSRDSLFYYSFRAASARDDSHLLLQPAPLGTILGLESIAVTGTRAYVTPTFAISNAVQQSGRTAHGPGLDLVAWLEAGSNGWDIRATRVKDGLPLDGEGLILGSGFPSSLEATYDGATFAIVWSDRDGIFLRRVDLNGTILDAAPIVISTAAAQQVSVAASGDGGLLVGWPDPQATVAYVRSGTVRNTQPAGTSQTGHQIEVGGSRDAFLGAFASPPLGCQFDPCIQDERPVMVRLVTAQGVPTGPPLPLTASILATVGEPVSHRGDWFVPILQPDGPRVVRVTGSGSAILGRVATIAGELRSAANGIEIL
ncbi:MAG TPA: hypothetical protein VFV54_05680, partial [Thermoanaerobaculia bacterium]|nr:hypothetical protein [Thermoanaerobaculia bacterium]